MANLGQAREAAAHSLRESIATRCRAGEAVKVAPGDLRNAFFPAEGEAEGADQPLAQAEMLRNIQTFCDEQGLLTEGGQDGVTFRKAG